MEVNELRDHLLAAAALACDEHRRIGWRHLAGEVDRPAKRRRGPEQRDLVGRGLPASLSVLLLTRLARHEQRMHGASDQDLEMRGRERLRQIIERALPQRFHARLDAGIAGHDDHDRVVVRAERRSQQCQPVDPRHVQIREYDIERPALEELQGILAAARDRDVISLVTEHGGAALAQGMLIVDYEDPNASLRFRPNRQQRTGLTPVAR